MDSLFLVDLVFNAKSVNTNIPSARIIVPMMYFIWSYLLKTKNFFCEVYWLCQFTLISRVSERFLVTGQSLEAFFIKSIFSFDKSSGI